MTKWGGLGVPWVLTRLRVDCSLAIRFFEDTHMNNKRKTPSRFARRMANRLAKAVGKCNKNLGTQFSGLGVREVIQTTAAAQFRHFNRELVRRARADEAAIFGPELSHHELMLLHKARRAEEAGR